MNFKLETKEKFQEIHLHENHLTANMTDILSEMLYDVMKKNPKNVILSLKAVSKMDIPFAQALTSLQLRFYEDQASFIICEMSTDLETALDEAEILETMNCAPTLSEAWDLVQMEEIEREMFND
jgi:MFS superfamily sulfate permease-like transporter